MGNLVAVISLLSLLIGCNAKTAEFFCDAPEEGYDPLTVIVDYERDAVARCLLKRCEAGDDVKLIGDLVLFTTGERNTLKRHQMNTETGDYREWSTSYKCHRKYF